ncbi:TetR/AcrR family transcriptional regulator [Lactobacillus terrae]|uniref:TetR/AcrR family transcriptional regulator n=1 Tax=Lactobacillus terrae TaxID=2269374 RepID=UPI000C1B6903|nr:TetR/AcrR family transcriptional regulator [Lactobacillus terrae]
MSQVTERTKRNIITSMISLLGKKSFDKITVKDICDEALINHSTFYRYYTDKFQLLRAVFSYLLEDLFNDPNQSESVTILSQVTEFIEKNNNFMRNISPQYQTKANLYPEFRSVLRDIVAKKYHEFPNTQDPLIKMIVDSPYPELTISFVVGGILGLIEYLEDNDFKIPKRNFTDFAENFLNLPK